MKGTTELNEGFDLVETASRSGNFRIFVQVLAAAGLEDTLRRAGPFTVFAPDDEAFVRQSKERLDDLFRVGHRELLRSVLRHHIVPEKILSADLKRRNEIKSVNGEELSIESRIGLWVNEAQITVFDLEASNGVIHGIDTVLISQSQAAAV
jgi:uncharacterized surface protein with fasciclin (FAS1) repeats